MSEMAYLMSSRGELKFEIAEKRISAFRKRFTMHDTSGKDVHLYLAYHAALPLAFTPDLLYALWSRFRHDIHSKELDIPWVAVANLLLSDLCTEVGYELYEMDLAVRSKLLRDMRNDTRLGQSRINEIANFLLAQVRHQLDNHDPDIHDLALAQYWPALACLRPGEALNKLANVFAGISTLDDAELVRMESIVEVLAEDSSQFEPLLMYARGMADFVRGDEQEAIERIKKVIGPDGYISIAGVRLPVPHEILRSVNVPHDPEYTLPTPTSHAQAKPSPLDSVANDIFQLVLEDELDHCVDILRSLKQAQAQYQRNYIEAERTLQHLRNTKKLDFSPEVRNIRRHLKEIENNLELVEVDISLLEHIQSSVQAEDYREVENLYKDNLLQHSGEAPHSSSFLKEVNTLIETLLDALITAVAYARTHGQFDNVQRAAAQRFLETEVLRRYHDYPPARELQREWGREIIAVGLQDDEQAYTALAEHVATIQSSFWSDDQNRQEQAVAQVRTLDLDAILTHPGLRQAQAAVEPLELLYQLDNPNLDQARQEVQDRYLRRRLLWLKAQLYLNDLEALDKILEMATDVPAHELQAVRQEREAVVKSNIALNYLENGQPEIALAAAKEADTIYPGTARLQALLNRIKHIHGIVSYLDSSLLNINQNLQRIESDYYVSDKLLGDIHDQLETIDHYIVRDDYLKQIYYQRYIDSKQNYLERWQIEASHLLERWQHPDALPELNQQQVDQINRLIEIAPTEQSFDIVAELQARALLCQAELALQVARLQTMEQALATAARLLPSDDPSVKRVRGYLTARRAQVESLKSRARTAQRAAQLNEARNLIARAFEADYEDSETVTLRNAINSAINATQVQARQAQEQEQHNLEQALQLWQAVCEQHRDGAYPDGRADARPLAQWRDQARYRRDTSLQQIAQLQNDIQELYTLLVDKQKPDWEQFIIVRERAQSRISKVSPGMRMAVPYGIVDAIRLLEQYRQVYQELERLLTLQQRPPNWSIVRTQAVETLREARQAIQDFSPGAEMSMPMLSAAIVASFDRIELLNKLKREDR